MEENITTGQIAKKYGLIYGLIGTLVSVLIIVLEIQSMVVSVIPTIIAAVIYVIADKEFRTANGGYMTFGEGFKINIVAALIGGSIRSVTTFAYIKLVDPTYYDRSSQLQLEKFQEQGMAEEQIEQSMKIVGGLSSPEIGLFIGVLFAVLGALIIGSIVAAVIKNENEESF